MPPVEKPVASAKPPAAWKMPTPCLGPCLWRTSPGQPAYAAIITQIGSRTVSVTVFAHDSRGGIPKDGTRHISDPELIRMVSNEGGCWDFTDDQKAIRALNSSQS